MSETYRSDSIRQKLDLSNVMLHFTEKLLCFYNFGHIKFHSIHFSMKILPLPLTLHF